MTTDEGDQMFQEMDIVVLKRDIPEYGLKTEIKGTPYLISNFFPVF
jgi:hypothetical protein